MNVIPLFAQVVSRAALPLLISYLLLLSLLSSFAASAQVLVQQDIAEVLTEHALANRFPSHLEFDRGEANAPLVGQVRYTFDQQFHKDMADVYLKYQPDYACFVALDVDTGAILNLTSFIKADEQWDNLVMRSDYPAASVFKVITAAAGLDTGKVTPESVIPFNGKSTTLYKSQVLRHKQNKWTREPTFKESFAKSVNPVFARLGVFQIGSETLTQYAQKFGFDQNLSSDFHLPQSKVKLDFDQQWEIAEAASGYTRDITLSPIHAAQMAAIIANDGKMVRPYMVESVIGQNGELLYRAQPSASNEQVVSVATAKQLRALMKETTRIGSARKSFSGLNRYKVYRGMEIGGKTGSLTGTSPQGRHDWFMGYAEKNGKRIAYASLIVNKEKWYVRSAYVARQFIYHYFTEADKQQSLAKASD